jgi:hypothetical protein
MRAMAPEIGARYQRASELLQDVLAARSSGSSRKTPQSVEGPASRAGRDDAQGIQNRLRAREGPAARFCWQCRKPLHARTDRCPFCGEKQ